MLFIVTRLLTLDSIFTLASLLTLDSIPSSPALPKTLEDSVLHQIQNGQALIVNARRRNGVVLCKPYHTEFAGPGSLIGGSLDTDCEKLIAVGKLSILNPTSGDDYHRACLIRRQWVILMYKMTSHEDPLDRARLLLNQFDNYFSEADMVNLSTEILSQLVGVFPSTFMESRHLLNSPDS